MPQHRYQIQRVQLFQGTIIDNLRIAAPEATDEQIRECVRLAGATEFIDVFPEGYETLLGTRGATLSGGQRQRLAVARALLRPAPLVILDEPTAMLDLESEDALISRLREHLAGRMLVVISHRPAPLALADRVIDLEALMRVDTSP